MSVDRALVVHDEQLAGGEGDVAEVGVDLLGHRVERGHGLALEVARHERGVDADERRLRVAGEHGGAAWHLVHLGDPAEGLVLPAVAADTGGGAVEGSRVRLVRQDDEVLGEEPLTDVLVQDDVVHRGEGRGDLVVVAQAEQHDPVGAQRVEGVLVVPFEVHRGAGTELLLLVALDREEVEDHAPALLAEVGDRVAEQGPQEEQQGRRAAGLRTRHLVGVGGRGGPGQRLVDGQVREHQAPAPARQPEVHQGGPDPLGDGVGDDGELLQPLLEREVGSGCEHVLGQGPQGPALILGQFEVRNSVRRAQRQFFAHSGGNGLHHVIPFLAIRHDSLRNTRVSEAWPFRPGLRYCLCGYLGFTRHEP